jgi:hypothetical protein
VRSVVLGSVMSKLDFTGGWKRGYVYDSRGGLLAARAPVLCSGITTFLHMKARMRKLTIRLIVASITFVIGLFFATLWVIHNYHAPEVTPLVTKPTSHLSPTVNIPEGWQKITVDGKFSFNLPGDMKEKAIIGDFYGPAKAFRNRTLEISYVYNDRFSCETPASLAAQRGYQISEVEVAGRKARQTFWPPDKPANLSSLTLCFPDLGDGKTRLQFGAIAEDEQALEVAKQIFSSIAFLPSS